MTRGSFGTGTKQVFWLMDHSLYSNLPRHI